LESNVDYFFKLLPERVVELGTRVTS